jgi:type IV secretory pathway TrbL component
MIRLFNVYYPLRTLVLLVGEALIVLTSFLLATIWRNPDSWLLGNVDGGYLQVLAALGPKLVVVTAVVLILSHLFDLYDSTSLDAKWDHAFRLLLVLGMVALSLAAVGTFIPAFCRGTIRLSGE